MSLTDKLLKKAGSERVTVGLQLKTEHHELLKKVSKVTGFKLYEVLDMLIEHNAGELEALVNNTPDSEENSEQIS